MTNKKIPGIHNYCDRWCERCSFTSRCSVYKSAKDSKPEELDLKNKAFWDRLAKNLAKAQGILEQSAEGFGIDLLAIAQGIKTEDEDLDRLRTKNSEHPLNKLNKEYVNVAGSWLKSQPGMLEKLESLREQLELDPESVAEAKIEADTINDCLSVIKWYKTFIYAKHMRATMDKLIDHESEDGFQQDYNGSAKIAMIGIERSMQAWVKLFELLPEKEDEFLEILTLIEKIKGVALKEFPNAKKFIRPGFDD